jgi:hypothetical protein
MKHKLGHDSYLSILQELEKSYKAYRENNWQKFTVKV